MPWDCVGWFSSPQTLVGRVRLLLAILPSLASFSFRAHVFVPAINYKKINFISLFGVDISKYSTPVIRKEFLGVLK
ncbi:hypothetical protein Pmani_011678 [Petrolisthes manimaculis]|uniref:Uncharacterized protein n=1 Tax=Petrolisthes manimaculis TaxID=1843537 RepID=A0AAE1Q0P1_9EUCA|nr:hypothetical protein Pmani_011678 [Petrolisthes manimaculis]